MMDAFMNQTFYFTHFTAAANYDCNAYGAGGYNAEQTCSSTTTDTSASGSTTNNNGLAATGTNILIGAGIGLALIIAGAIILLKLRHKKHSATRS